jgi:hypothetical protein
MQIRERFLHDNYRFGPISIVISQGIRVMGQFENGCCHRTGSIELLRRKLRCHSAMTSNGGWVRYVELVSHYCNIEKPIVSIYN